MTSREPKQNDCMKPSDNSERYYSPALTNYKTEIRRTEMNCLRDWSMHQGLLTLKPAQCLVHSRSLHAKELQVSGEQVDRELDKAWQKLSHGGEASCSAYHRQQVLSAQRERSCWEHRTQTEDRQKQPPSHGVLLETLMERQHNSVQHDAFNVSRGNSYIDRQRSVTRSPDGKTIQCAFQFVSINW